MPAPHRLSLMHALGGDQAKQARDELAAILADAGGKVPEAAKALGVHQKTFHRWLTEWGVRGRRGRGKHRAPRVRSAKGRAGRRGRSRAAA